jgi:predicted dehydrogenase
MSSQIPRSRRFRVAIVGCGRISNAHVQAVLASPEAELAALIDPVESRARALADRYEVETTIRSNIADVVGQIDGAVIATPNHLHAEAALVCIQAGVATLIEKPLAASVADGTRIADAAAAAGVVTAVGYVTRFRDNIQLMRDLLRRGTFGRVHRFVYQFGTRGGWAPLSAYNLDSKTAGGGVLVVTGTHFLDRMLDWFGYPVQASLRDDSLGGPEANAIATFEFDHPAGPIAGTARFSKSVTLEAGLVLETDAGIVIFRDRPDAPIVLRASQTPHLDTSLTPRAIPHAAKGPSEFVLQLENFISAARSRTEPMISARQGLESLRLLESLYRHRQPL